MFLLSASLCRFYNEYVDAGCIACGAHFFSSLIEICRFVWFLIYSDASALCLFFSFFVLHSHLIIPVIFTEASAVVVIKLQFT